MRSAAVCRDTGAFVSVDLVRFRVETLCAENGGDGPTIFNGQLIHARRFSHGQPSGLLRTKNFPISDTVASVILIFFRKYVGVKRVVRP